ncbi:MAG: hypothetical protein ABJK59_10260, partial [Erythrobacter sp.]|uniref:hypothetical protein n=1 Tax=Erythrobacter sp. TaxID=1042 RepID=UPI003297434F
MAGTFADDFAFARPIARHCNELTWRGPRPGERDGVIAAWTRDLSSELSHELGQILQGDKLEVKINAPQVMIGSKVFETIGPVAVNSLLRIGSGDQTVLLSLDYPTAIALTDSSFGGDGSLPTKAPAQLPRSAGLLVEQLGAQIAQAIDMVRGTGEPAQGDVLVRSENVARLKPFSGEAEISVLEMTASHGTNVEWQMLLALPSERLEELLPQSNSTRSSSEETSSKGGDPYNFLPLSVEAVLSEVEMPLARLQNLSPGDEVALHIPRELPLRIGTDVFA